MYPKKLIMVFKLYLKIMFKIVSRLHVILKHAKFIYFLILTQFFYCGSNNFDSKNLIKLIYMIIFLTDIVSGHIVTTVHL